jgi:hypothetical protein
MGQHLVVGARLTAGVWSYHSAGTSRARLPRAHQPSDAIRHRLSLVSCAGGGMHEVEESMAVAAEVPEDLPEEEHAPPPEVPRFRLMRRRHRPPMLGVQSSTTADQENLPLANPPPACCIVNGGVCKIKTKLLLRTSRAWGSWRGRGAAFRGGLGSRKIVPGGANSRRSCPLPPHRRRDFRCVSAESGGFKSPLSHSAVSRRSAADLALVWALVVKLANVASIPRG